ncbi:tautomerase family protein [Enterobacteriaceae bacterium RIT691]|nr:tautomerase family protein [Enterobacteriaceae bacterium RIT691]
MPFTRISCRQDCSDDEIDRISAILHQALVSEFAVPEKDRFQIFERVPERLRVFDSHYLSAGRTQNFLLFQITAGKMRTREQKQNFYRALSDGLQRELGVSPADVMVVIQFTQAEDWSFSAGTLFTPAVAVLPASPASGGK